MRFRGDSAWAFVLVAGLLLSGDLDAGSLEPPGPPAPTMKTIEQSEPRIPISSLPTSITQSGSYYLTASLTGVVGNNGISIYASNVTLDLNGFSMNGGAGSYDGISFGAGTGQVVIRNGIIRNWGRRGIDGLAVPEVTVEKLVIDSNGQGGVRIGARGSVRDSTVTNNTGDGIRADSGSTIAGCKAGSNTGSGIVGQADVTVSGSSAVSNGATGIVLDRASLATDCTASGNLTGFVLYAGSRVIHSTARQNSDGISAAGYGVSIEQCTAEANSDDGITAGYEALVRGNLANDNVGNGIHVTGSGSRIEDNESTDNQLSGIRVDAAFNFIAKNRTYANATPYTIVAGNKVGTISADPATAGPWANF